MVYETESAQDLDDGIFDLSRYVTPCNQAGERVRAGPAASSSSAPRSALNLAPGTSLTLWCMRQRVLLQLI
ncbi:hypothetical protein [Anaplasma phagocytophilum]|uniref:Uncharacterized protein n=2 Tax=Anaplasma phagocytophilum TaxID=948 RepID=Q2GJK7_ANAPZ|nr:hypothetical protein [Anaplasma phagocytophilum]KJZ99026.1 hypothetical protein APHCR_0369 [Anaplasma phagocytophilum str. CR1007]ABD43654.1 hypothetical protein APH_0868 [Anaplasma phagocytophilum str. HZ]AGR79524.1 hypothetical protein YYU_03995 [Anaplasma phagocytophilum str. HZ2]AGR80775.1 hypothetical protein WSQ_04005 [Anaplasma phagocytophilum str. JM]AGR82027.1 hypothetical protein YYY_03995 [Anaplasma phagocytophilum str. Dog2]